MFPRTKTLFTGMWAKVPSCALRTQRITLLEPSTARGALLRGSRSMSILRCVNVGGSSLSLYRGREE